MSKSISLLISRSARPLLLLAVTLVLSACGDSGINVNTTFSNAKKIPEGTAVYFEDKKVGEVSEVRSQDNEQLVDLSIDEEFAKSISGNAAVVVSQLNDSAALEIYNRGIENGVMLADGQSLKGLDSMFQLGAWMLGDAIQLGAGSFSDYVETFQEYLQSEKFQQDKEVVTEQLNSATAAASQALEQVESELNKATNEFAVSEDEAAQAIEQLGDELAPLVSELSKSGALLMEQLRQFTEGLEQTNLDEKQAGEDFLASLLATIEKLNQSIEEGNERQVDDESVDIEE